MKSYYNPTTFHDLLLNSLLGFVLLFTVAILLINPEAKKADIETKAEYVITVTWPEGYTSDVDTWLEDPAGNVIFFRNKEDGLMHLDRDDLGSEGDTRVINGQRIVYPYNQEITTIRGFIPGEWVLNIHMYRKQDSGPVPVTVKIDKLNPKVQTVFVKVFDLNEQWQEKTVARFVMTADGDITEWSELPKELVSIEQTSNQALYGSDYEDRQRLR